MKTLSRGQKVRLSDIGIVDSALTVRIDLSQSNLDIDVACFGLDAQEKLSDDRYMIFYNQPASPLNEIQIAVSQGTAVFTINTAVIPESIGKLVFTAAISGDASMRSLAPSVLQLGDAQFHFSGADFDKEKAVMLCEIYRKDGVWRFGVIGQGFNDGLPALVKHFGGEVAEDAQAPTPPKTAVDLLKRVEQQAPQLVSLVKQATVSLEKVGLSSHKAKVCLVLDISGSMHMLYKLGKVQQFAERILALGCKFDDDQEIDVFLFGEKTHQPVPMSLLNTDGYVSALIKKYPLEGDTKYGLAMEAVRKFYYPDCDGQERKVPIKSQCPVYVMFVTDGTTSDKSRTEKQLRWSSKEAIFWQFLGLGRGKKSKQSKVTNPDSDFPFLEKLDELDGRFIDNANFFSVASPDEHSDADLYELLMSEYPQWLKLAKQNGLL